jgi:hypothetical protein
MNDMIKTLKEVFTADSREFILATITAIGIFTLTLIAITLATAIGLN